MAIAYYERLAKTRMILPKRDDADLAVEVEPKLDELLRAADAIDSFISDARLPKEADDA
jgi:hypothetical protein